MSTNSTSEPRELTETPDLNGAYPRLDEAGIAALAPLGRRRRVQPEEVLFREGDRDCQFFVVPAEAASIEEDGGQYLVRLTDGSPVTATSVVIATGARYRRLDVPRLDHFEKTSVYYAASQAEALLCAGDPVAIVGDGFVRTGQDTGRSALETSRPGIFAVGDVRSGSARRVATAVGEGAMAIRLAFERTRPG